MTTAATVNTIEPGLAASFCRQDIAASGEIAAPANGDEDGSALSRVAERRSLDRCFIGRVGLNAGRSARKHLHNSNYSRRKMHPHLSFFAGEKKRKLRFPDYSNQSCAEVAHFDRHLCQGAVLVR